MSVNRLILIVLISGGLILFLTQNWSLFPSISIRILSMSTRSFPLGVWVIISMLCGALTSLLINVLLQLNGYSSSVGNTRKPKKTSTKGYSRGEYADVNVRETYRNKSSRDVNSPSRGKSRVNSRRSYTEDYIEDRRDNYQDDWENPGNAEDWGFEDKPKSSPDDYPYRKNTNRNSNKSTTIEDKEPEFNLPHDNSPEQSENESTSAPKTIYDADYRVIVPPKESPDTFQEDEVTNTEDDWSFLEDDDFTIDKNPKPST